MFMMKLKWKMSYRPKSILNDGNDRVSRNGKFRAIETWTSGRTDNERTAVNPK